MPAGPPPATRMRRGVADFAMLPSVALAPGHRVLDAGDADAHVVVPDAGLVAGDAGADVVDAALAGLVGHLGVRDHRPRHAAHVGLSGGKHCLGDLRLVDAAGDEYRQADGSAQRAGLRRHIGVRDLHRRDNVHRAAEALHRAVGGVDVVDRSLCLQRLADGDHLILARDRQAPPRRQRCACRRRGRHPGRCGPRRGAC